MFSQRFLTIYSGVLTATFAVTVLSGFAKRSRSASFDDITVRRINIVEPDGTLRMVLSNKAQCPGFIIKGKEYPREDRQTAGVIFFDDEGTEDGGLIFGGAKTDGKVESFGHLSFDQYQQDQVFTIDAGDENGRRHSGIGITDRGDYPIMEAFEASLRIRKLPPAEQEGEWRKFLAAHPGDAQRAYFGRSGDKSVGLRLMDPQGRDRVRLQVKADGTPVLELLDASGGVVAHLPEPPPAH
ncbi:MAG TPA: hypothetical protein VMI94_10390 [Bryobacteraceae bacterium]|nr:hypothetical protein [Bryobacteraceae bacterium]